MHAKSAEVTQFLDKDLLPQVKEAFGLYKTADKAELEKELAKVDRPGTRRRGWTRTTRPRSRSCARSSPDDAVDVGALENEVYDHLFSFFRRYYSEGDFLAKRVYKPGVYAIPYEGEEVKLHWANEDQYYIKTSEYLRDYAFRLRPDDDKNADARALPAGGRRRGRARQREGRRGQGPRRSSLQRRGFGRDFVRGGRRAGQGAGHPLRVPPGDARRLARGAHATARASHPRRRT